MVRNQEVWPPRQIARLQSQLNELAHLASTTSDDDARPFLARLLVIRSSGYLEQTAFEVFRYYISACSGGQVKSFAHTWVEKTRNPSAHNLEEMVGRFDAEWREQFGAFLDDQDERLRRELAFLINTRNQIAHGLNEGIGLQKALQLKGVAIEIANWIVAQFRPHGTRLTEG